MSKLHLSLLKLFLVNFAALASANTYSLAVPESLNPAIKQAGQSQQVKPGEVPTGLSRSDWADIQAKVAAGKYRAYQSEDGGFVASNSAHGWQIKYGTDGTTILKPRDSEALPYFLGLKLAAVGYTEMMAVDHPHMVTSEDAIVTYQWTAELREWWVNSEAGLEQWFEITKRPSGASNGQPLTLQMALKTDLTVSQNGNDLSFVDDGGTYITYNKLKVWDSTGSIIPANMLLRDGSLSLIVNDRLAVYPLIIDPSFFQIAYLKASNTDADDRFGWSVDIDADTAVVGAPYEASSTTGIDGNQEDNSASGSGAAYVFIQKEGVWSQQAYLKASNTDAGDLFGWSIAISGDTLVVGANFEDSNAKGVDGDQTDNSASKAGAAYVFTRTAGVWSQQAYLKASNTIEINDFNFEFGYSVGISGDTIVVGAPNEFSDAIGVNGDEDSFSGDSFMSGAAYIFVRTAGVWVQQAHLKASNPGAHYRFGISVAISGNTLAVGSPGEDSNATGGGAAYVFTRTSDEWSQQAYLKASNADAGDSFGGSVAISGNTLVIGAPGEESNAFGVNGNQADNSAGDSGAAYVFTRSSDVWSQEAYLKASNTDVGDRFGSSAAITEGVLAIGAGLEDSNATGVNGDETNNSALHAGAAYVFTRTSDEWSQQDYIKASNPGYEHRFGYFNQSIAITSDSLIVGSYLEDSDSTGVNGNQANSSAADAGAAYVFNLGFKIRGTVTGLVNGNSVAIQNNSGDDLTVDTNGDFTFATPLANGSEYDVAVYTQPSSTLYQTCSVTNGSGTLSGADVTNVSVTCVTDEFSVGGSVTGLAAAGLVLINNDVDELPIGTNGVFAFSDTLPDGSSYSVRVLTPPNGQNCGISNSEGVLTHSDVTNIEVICITGSHTVGGTVTGLDGSDLVLQNNAADDLVISSNGSFTFATPLINGSSYEVSVNTQPNSIPSQTCSVSNGSGTLAGVNVTDVSVDCVINTFAVGGTVSGLDGSGLVLQNNAGDDLLISSNGSFTFATPLDDGSTYAVSVLTQPSDFNQTCSIINGGGTLTGADITNVVVNCVTDTYAVGGEVIGLSGSGLVLQNNATDDLAISANGSFSFATDLVDGTSYDVSVMTQPSSPHQECTVSNGSGTVSGAPIANISITCTNTYRVGGMVSGLSGSGLVLQNNAGDNLMVFGNGSFTFATALVDGSSYAVTVQTQPSNPSQTCNVTNGSGILDGADISNVEVLCHSEIIFNDGFEE